MHMPLQRWCRRVVAEPVPVTPTRSQRRGVLDINSFIIYPSRNAETMVEIAPELNTLGPILLHDAVVTDIK